MKSYLRIFTKEDWRGVCDDQLISKIMFLKKTNNLTEWEKEVSNPILQNHEARMMAHQNKDYRILAIYIDREDTNLSDAILAFESCKRDKMLLQRVISRSIILKSDSFLKNKKPEEKLMYGIEINSKFLLGIILEQEDVKDYILNLPAEEAIKLTEKIDYISIWNLILKNQNVQMIK